MRRHLLSFLVLFIALTIGLFISPSDETSGIRGLIFGMRAFLNDAVDSHSGLRNEHLGLWKDYDGHVLRVNEYSVVDADCPFTTNLLSSNVLAIRITRKAIWCRCSIPRQVMLSMHISVLIRMAR